MDSTPTPLIAQELGKLGVSPEKAALIEHALAQGDGRALLHELLLRGLWDNVVDESLPQPLWMAQWLALGANGFPLINTEALQRLMQAGVDVHDLTDVVRSAQILTIYNIAQQLDHPTLALGWDIPEQAALRLRWTVGESADKPHPPVHGWPALHPELLDRDPSGRCGEPRTLEWRQFRGLPPDVQEQIQVLVEARKISQAAALWKQHIGGELRHCLATVQRLAGQLENS